MKCAAIDAKYDYVKLLNRAEAKGANSVHGFPFDSTKNAHDNLVEIVFRPRHQHWIGLDSLMCYMKCHFDIDFAVNIRSFERHNALTQAESDIGETNFQMVLNSFFFRLKIKHSKCDQGANKLHHDTL